MLDRTSVDNIIDKTGFDLSLNDYEDIYNGYIEAMKEGKNIGKTDYEQGQLVSDIAYGRSIGEDMRTSLKPYRTSTYYDNIANLLGEDVLNAFDEVRKNYDIPTDFVHGLKLQSSKKGATTYHYFTTNDGKPGYIEIKFEDWSKYEIEELRIVIDGEEVYSYRSQLFGEYDVDLQDEESIDKLQEIMNSREKMVQKRIDRREELGLYRTEHKGFETKWVEEGNGYKPVIVDIREGNNGQTYYYDSETHKRLSKATFDRIMGNGDY